MLQLTRASSELRTGSSTSSDRSSCRSLASSPPVLPLLSLPNSLLLIFWSWKLGHPKSQHASSPRRRLVNHDRNSII
ncbi:hypothetical protein BDA96_02G328100 [Sorghum bicolor]|uniref:Uncharacterized protein n=2 Tax=Sorghum bicolor TaxID=4558 RepID=A0A921RS20_SORBI|nr:hypothetical protein BDA96_02G328100 [Sorghum bicolor]KXG36285.1 hypothetical protein SORBI_3002G312500 [Sorghum bicolor]